MEKSKKKSLIDILIKAVIAAIGVLTGTQL